MKHLLFIIGLLGLLTGLLAQDFPSKVIISPSPKIEWMGRLALFDEDKQKIVYSDTIDIVLRDDGM